MESKLIKTYVIPADVSKQFAKYRSLELYTDRLVGKGGPNGDIIYFFKNYVKVTWTPASLASQFAYLVFLSHENSANYISGSNINNMADTNKIPFCSGMFSYKRANEYTKSLYMDINAAMNKFQSAPQETSTVIQAPLSSADELKKYKELLDAGIITQAEFDEKKKQLLGL